MAEQGLKNKKTSEVRKNLKGSLYEGFFVVVCLFLVSKLFRSDLKGRRVNGYLEKLWDERHR